jgi:hypothetical protein|nr:MAG TPA: hypothetical protein [Caudoviricetes sp.]
MKFKLTKKYYYSVLEENDDLILLKKIIDKYCLTWTREDAKAIFTRQSYVVNEHIFYVGIISFDGGICKGIEIRVGEYESVSACMASWYSNLELEFIGDLIYNGFVELSYEENEKYY